MEYIALLQIAAPFIISLLQKASGVGTVSQADLLAFQQALAPTNNALTNAQALLNADLGTLEAAIAAKKAATPTA